jgi:PTS system nitrogen regulatory IIA component
MPRAIISVAEVAAILHVSQREVVRMAEKGILPAAKTRRGWQFRAGEVWDWVEENLQGLPARRARDAHPPAVGDLLIAPVLRCEAVAVDLPARTRASLLRELARLAGRIDPAMDTGALAAALLEREERGTTALQDGVAVPHPGRPLHGEGPVLAAARTSGGIAFGEGGGGLTDLFFLVWCPGQREHLLYLGRLCRLLIDRRLQAALREAADAPAFVDALCKAERRLCGAAGPSE